jgi:hypothetical protein
MSIRGVVTALAAGVAGFGGAVAVTRAAGEAPAPAPAPRTAAAFAPREREIAVRDAARAQALPPLHRPPKHVRTVVVDGPPVAPRVTPTTQQPPQPTTPAPTTRTVAPPSPRPTHGPTTIISN